MSNFSITTIHHDLFEDVSKAILSSILGSMNFRAVAYARMHLRADAREQVSELDRPLTNDDRNDADAAIAEAKQRTEAGQDFGFNVQMAPGELASSMMTLRGFFVDRVFAIGIKSQRDKPGTIAETIKYMIDREPAADSKDKAHAIAIALDIDPDILAAADFEDQQRDIADLKRNTGKIITYLDGFEVDDVSDVDAEFIFDALPAHIQYKIIAKVIGAYEKQAKYQLVRVMRGNMDAASNYKMLKAKRDEAVMWLNTFSKAKTLELEDYMDRGGDLPEFSNTVVDSNDTMRATSSNVVVGRNTQTTQAASARAKEDADAHEAEVQAKVAANKMKRAPAPVK